MPYTDKAPFESAAQATSDARSVEDEKHCRNVERPLIDLEPPASSETEPRTENSSESADPSRNLAALSLLGTSTSTAASLPGHAEEHGAGMAQCSASPSSNLDACHGDDPDLSSGSSLQQQIDCTSRIHSGGQQLQPEAAGPAKPPVPADFCCPISMDIMRDPVLVATGQTYDKACIEKWLNSGRRTCPKTGVRLRHIELTPNIALRNIIQDWAYKNNIALQTSESVPASPRSSMTDNISHGHEEIIWAITKRDRRFFSASADRTVRVWDAVSGRCQHVLEGHQRPVLSLATTDSHLFSGSYDFSIRAWDMGSMRLVKVMQGHRDAVRALKVVGDRLFSGSYDGSVRAWSTTSLLLEGCMQQHKGPVRTLVHSGRCVFSGSYDHTICAWHTDTLALEGQLVGHADSVRALAETESLVFSGSDDTTIRAWDSSTLQHVSTFKGHEDNVRVLAASPTHPRMLFSGSWDKTVRVWDTRARSCVKVLIGHTEAVLALAVGRTRLATGSYDSMVRFWDLATLQCVKIARGHTDAVRVIEADGDSFVSGAYDGAVGMW